MVNTTGRHLVIVRYTKRVLVQTAYRERTQAQAAADRAWQAEGVQNVETAYVPNYRGRRVTKVIL